MHAMYRFDLRHRSLVSQARAMHARVLGPTCSLVLTNLLGYSLLLQVPVRCISSYTDTFRPLCGCSKLVSNRAVTNGGAAELDLSQRSTIVSACILPLEAQHRVT